MKKLWRTLIAVLTVGLATCLFFGMQVSAEMHSGEITNYLGNKLFWEVDTEAGTLTISGYGGAFPSEEPVAWAEWEDAIDEIILLGEGAFTPAGTNAAYANSFKRINPDIVTSKWGDGFSWVYDGAARKLTYYGIGITESGGWNLFSLGLEPGLWPEIDTL